MELMNENEAKRLADIWLGMSDEECAFLKSVVNYTYEESSELSSKLLARNLIARHRALLVPTDDGREIAKLC